jgi:hypothetical protein
MSSEEAPMTTATHHDDPRTLAQRRADRLKVEAHALRLRRRRLRHGLVPRFA